MFGGVPAAEVEDLGAYWDAFPALKSALFSDLGSEYLHFGVTDIKKAVEEHGDIRTFEGMFDTAFASFDTVLYRELLGDVQSVNVSKEESALASQIFERLAGIPLVDQYEAYQLLDNEWTRIAVDLEIVQTEGFEAVKKVDPNMRSYQYYAANKISDTVAKHQWENGSQMGGFIWHTTGSGKTMTSFKSAQLIANSKDADKVIFLIDRIELGTQSALEYRGFAEETDSIQETEDTAVLIAKLKSPDPANTLIVTSIQKMSNIKDDALGRLKKADLDVILKKRIVFIVDECHRDTFGDMTLR